MKTAAEKAAEAIEREYSNADGFSPVHAEHMTPIISREYLELEQAAEKLIERYVCNPGTDHEFVACITEVTPWTSCKGGRKTWKMWESLRSALSKVRGQQ